MVFEKKTSGPGNGNMGWLGVDCSTASLILSALTPLSIIAGIVVLHRDLKTIPHEPTLSQKELVHALENMLKENPMLVMAATGKAFSQQSVVPAPTYTISEMIKQQMSTKSPKKHHLCQKYRNKNQTFTIKQSILFQNQAVG